MVMRKEHKADRWNPSTVTESHPSHSSNWTPEWKSATLLLLLHIQTNTESNRSTSYPGGKIQ